ncbi:MAG: hypothetical protein CL484_05395 [Acidobacteria bacterium]|nr:hypothetical protein [Acidobacteriota bacterium]|tara:strand:+ start:4929 stop:6512 length:1584 start_codon:yes stop_codon:yes gene_type:complete
MFERIKNCRRQTTALACHREWLGCLGGGSPSFWFQASVCLGLCVACHGGLFAQNNGSVSLIEAIRQQDVALARSLLPDSNLNAVQSDGATALHWAVYHDDLEMADLLISAGADPDIQNELGVRPLILACQNSNSVLVKSLLDAGAEANFAVGTGETGLMGCARTGNLEAVTALVEAGADVSQSEQGERQTALMWAVAHGHTKVARLLLEHGADVRARSRVRRQVISRRLQSELKYGELGRSYGTDAEETLVGGFTPLLFAARHGDIDTARVLLEYGADVNDRSPDGASALVIAVHSGHGSFAAFLLEQGANPNAAGSGYTALHAAVLTGDSVVVEELLDYGARPDPQVTLATRVTRNGQVLMLGEHLLGATPFALAAKFTEVAIMQALLDAGADVHLPLKTGWTPLMLASGASWRYAVWDRRDRALAKAPGFQRQMYDENTTYAAVQMLLDRGSDVNAVDEDLNTALHHVVNKGFDRVVELLINHGADFSAVNRRGQTPLAIVAQGRTGNVEAASATAELLQTLGAR